MSESENYISQIVENVLQGRRRKEDEGIDEGYSGKPGVYELVNEALEKGVDLERILTAGLSGGMKLVGDKFETGEYFIPDMLAAAEAVGVAMDIIEPHLLQKGGQEKKGKVVMATVEKDVHDIGKNLACILLRGAGFSVIDLGVNVPAGRIAEVVEKERAGLVGLSALLDTTMPLMRSTVQELEKRNLRDKVKVMIGGAPTSETFAREIGADAYGADAFAAVSIAEKLLVRRE
jgi:5-methyltetrahydrofolate--homocysteine methyltransferase